MMIAGNIKYPWVSGSPSSTHGLGFKIKEEAESHMNNMNNLLLEWDISKLWNKEFWKSKPQNWIVEKVK